MRISDWSSDVCSSDLQIWLAVPGDGQRMLSAAQCVPAYRTDLTDHRHRLAALDVADIEHHHAARQTGRQIHGVAIGGERSEERRVGEEGVGTVKSRW